MPSGTIPILLRAQCRSLMISVYNDGFRDRRRDPSGDLGASVSLSHHAEGKKGPCPEDSGRAGGRTGRSGANPGAAAGTAVRVRIMRLRATHISGPPPRFKVTLLIVEARTASSCQMKCDYLAQTWTVKHERKMNLTKFFFGVAVGPLYISSKLFPYFAKEKFSLLHFLAAKKFS